MANLKLVQEIARLVREYGENEVKDVVSAIIGDTAINEGETISVPTTTTKLNIYVTPKKQAQYERDKALYDEYKKSGLSIRQFAILHDELKERQVYNIINKFANQ